MADQGNGNGNDGLALRVTALESQVGALESQVEALKAEAEDRKRLFEWLAKVVEDFHTATTACVGIRSFPWPNRPVATQVP